MGREKEEYYRGVYGGGGGGAEATVTRPGRDIRSMMQLPLKERSLQGV